MSHSHFEPKLLHLLVLSADGKPLDAQTTDAVGQAMQGILAPQDRFTIGSLDTLERTGEWDAAMVWAPCGSSITAGPLADVALPCFALSPPLVFHPFFAAFYREVERRGGITLPADDPGSITASLQAVRARKTLRGTRLLVVDAHADDRRASEIAAFALGCRQRFGVEILHFSADELEARATAITDNDAQRLLNRWQSELFEEPGEMDAPHMHQIARLYLAERALLDETGAAGITVDDIGAFLLHSPARIMPNVTYAALVCEGVLACEEGDIEALMSELLLRVGLGAHPTMSNIYLAFRDEFDALGTHEGYSFERERADFEQCVRDHHLVAAHFSASGVLPPGMMEEERYRVRQTLPAWPGQSMVGATPRLGPVILARLNPDGRGIHLVPGQVDGRTMDDRFGWYRGRWFIRVPSVPQFIAKCLHQHYAIGPENGQSKTLEILTERLLGPHQDRYMEKCALKPSCLVLNSLILVMFALLPGRPPLAASALEGVPAGYAATVIAHSHNPQALRGYGPVDMVVYDLRKVHSMTPLTLARFQCSQSHQRGNAGREISRRPDALAGCLQPNRVCWGTRFSGRRSAEWLLLCGGRFGTQHLDRCRGKPARHF